MQKKPITKYLPYPKVELPDRQWPNRVIDRAPQWCSVDLRDGNQALSIPMNTKEKLEMFKLLCGVGFKQIEVGFPSASDTEYEFIRHLIDNDLIPDDVEIQVLVQAREHLIRRTFESIRGAKQAIVHLYNSTNPLQRRVTFEMDKEQIKSIAVKGTQLVKSLVPTVADTHIRYEYSPESFSDTELEYSLEVCEAVMDAWDPAGKEPIILNLPATVELATPNIHADQIEWFCRHIKNRDKAIISLHTHNDRGTGTAATELALMAGADRIEGTLFGNGERTGNLDIVTVALNMYTQGVDPYLDFSKIEKVREIYERCTRMLVHERHPYGGDLVFTAFSGSHQDAIKKGMDKMDLAPSSIWQVPYLAMDPEDIGRNYEAIIRINSQSGKGGVAFVMEQEFGLDLPKKMYPDFGAVVNKIADAESRELNAQEIREAFNREYIERESPLSLKSYNISSDPEDHHHVNCQAEIIWYDEIKNIEGIGNGPIAAFVSVLDHAGLKNFRLLDFRQHAITRGSAADAAAYIQIERIADKKLYWGAGIDANIELASLKALVSAYNRAYSKDEPMTISAEKVKSVPIN